MGFTNKIFLYALISVLIPIIIHLFGINRPIKEVFAPLPILLKIKGRIIKRKRLHSMILLLLRILFFGFVVIVFAGPYFEYISYDSSPSDSCLILIDNSPSSGVSINGNKILKNLLLSVENYAEKRREICGNFVVITLSDKKRFEGSIDILKKDILNENKVVTGYRPVNIERDLIDILTIEREKRYNEVVLFSDMFEHIGYTKESIFRTLKENNIKIQDIDIPPVSNAFINSIMVEDVEFEKGLNLKVSLENGGESPFYGSLYFYDGDKLVEKTPANIPPLDRAELSFNLQSQNSTYDEHFFKFYIEGDNFDYDNTEYYYYKRKGGKKILFINGEPSSDETKSETFFLSNALKSFFGESIKIYSVLEDILPETPELYDLILLANVSAIDKVKSEIFSKYLKSGGRIIITLGGRIDITNYNKLEFLPADIIRLIDVEKNESMLIEDSLFFSSIPELENSLRKVRLNRLFEVVKRNDSKVFVKTSEGRPLLIGRDFGNGIVMLYTTSIDMDMNDFPVKKNYLPFFSLVFSKMLENNKERRIIYSNLGEEISLKTNDCELGELTLKGNKIFKVMSVCKDNFANEKIITFNAPYEKGFYIIDSNNLSVLLIVNTNKYESNLKRIKIIDKDGDIKSINVPILSSKIIKDGRLNLVEILLILSGILLILEMFVMNKR